MQSTNKKGDNHMGISQKMNNMTIFSERIKCTCGKIFTGNNKWKEFKKHRINCKKYQRAS